MAAIISNNDSFSGFCWSFTGRYSINNQTARNFTTSGYSHIAGLECENLFRSSGHTQIHASILNKMIVSGSTNLSRSTVNELRSSGHLQATDCPRLGKIVASGHAAITRCKEIAEIVASGAFTLDDSKVTGNVILSGDRLEISDSTIAGKMECSAKIIKICNSSIGQIIVKPIKSSFELFGWKTFSPIEQLIELSGDNCQVGSIVFEDGAVGKVRLVNGAQTTADYK